MIKVVSVSVPLHGHLDLVFSDDTVGRYDMSVLLGRTGVMIEPLKSPAYFARVFLEHGAPTWPNGFDLSPWELHRVLSESGDLQSKMSAA